MKIYKKLISFFVPLFSVSGGGGSAPANTTSTVTQQMDPEQSKRIAELWKQVQTFTDNNSTLSSAQTALNGSYKDQLTNTGNALTAQNTANQALGQDFLTGKYNTDFAPVENAQLPSTATTFNPAAANSAGKADKLTAAQNAGYDAFIGKDAQAANPSSYKYYRAIQTDVRPDLTSAQSTNSLAALSKSNGMNLSPAQTSQYQSAAGGTPSTYTNAQAAQTGDLTSLRAAQGAVDPTSALSKLLSGQVDNPYLSSINQASIDQSMRGYNDAIQNLNQQTMPGINNDAFAAGQYGGSSQGVAQGLALQQMDRNARDLGIAAMDSGNQLFGKAYSQAQNNMATTANNVNDQSLQAAQFNTSNQQATNLTNAQNAMQNSQFNSSNQQALNLANAQNAMQNQQFNASAQNATNQQDVANNLQNQQFNSSAANANALANAQSATQNSQFNTSASNAMNQFNATNYAQQEQFNIGAINAASSANAANNLQNSPCTLR